MIKLISTLLTSLAIVGCSDATSNYHGKGTMKNWMQAQTSKEGLELRWNMNGDYNIEELHKSELKDIPLGEKIKLLEQQMTLDNLTKKIEWSISHQGQMYPYPIMVVSAICKNSVVFAEVEDLDLYRKNLLQGVYQDCKPTPSTLGVKAPPAQPVNPAPVPNQVLPPFAAPPPMPGASAVTQVPMAAGQFTIPLIGDPNKEFPDELAPKNQTK